MARAKARFCPAVSALLTEAVNKPWNERASVVEAKIYEEITTAMGDSFNPKYFVPYVQLHEFEALAFADVDVLASVLTPIGQYPIEWLTRQFREILNQAGHPEAINDSYETCPSRRIAGVVPAYKKRAQGPIVTGRIGINVLREKCSHFGEWLTRLERLNGGGA